MLVNMTEETPKDEIGKEEEDEDYDDGCDTSDEERGDDK